MRDGRERNRGRVATDIGQVLAGVGVPGNGSADGLRRVGRVETGETVKSLGGRCQVYGFECIDYGHKLSQEIPSAPEIDHHVVALRSR